METTRAHHSKNPLLAISWWPRSHVPAETQLAMFASCVRGFFFSFRVPISATAPHPRGKMSFVILIRSEPSAMMSFPIFSSNVDLVRGRTTVLCLCLLASQIALVDDKIRLHEVENYFIGLLMFTDCRLCIRSDVNFLRYLPLNQKIFALYGYLIKCACKKYSVGAEKG